MKARRSGRAALGVALGQQEAVRHGDPPGELGMADLAYRREAEGERGAKAPATRGPRSSFRATW